MSKTASGKPRPSPDTAAQPAAAQPVVDPTPHRGSHTTPQVDGDQRSPRLPHERDESSDSQPGGDSDGVIKQAHDDLERGLVDTDRGPVLDRTYEHSVRPPDGATRDRAAPDDADPGPVRPAPARRG